LSSDFELDPGCLLNLPYGILGEFIHHTGHGWQMRITQPGF
jgi:hypothetical protein